MSYSAVSVYDELGHPVPAQVLCGYVNVYIAFLFVTESFITVQSFPIPFLSPTLLARHGSFFCKLETRT